MTISTNHSFCNGINSLQNTCMCRRPPGNEVYRIPSGHSVYEVEACTNVMYCEHLCSLSRLFAEPELQMVFSSPSHLFYILTKNDQHGGSHLIGYFVRVMTYNSHCLVVIQIDITDVHLFIYLNTGQTSGKRAVSGISVRSSSSQKKRICISPY